MGIPIVLAYLEFQRDYFNRTLLVPNANDNWVYGLELD